MRIGKLNGDLEDVVARLESEGFARLDLEISHLRALLALPVHADHRDPFDHLLIAQAIAEGAVFVSQDRYSGRYEVDLLRCRP